MAENSINAFETLPREDWGKLLSTFDSLFRLESLPRYKVPRDYELSLQYAADPSSLPELPSVLAEWGEIIRPRIEHGASASRVRTIPATGLNDYLRYEIFYAYPITKTFGDVAYILPHEKAPSLVDSLDEDFTILNNDTVVRIIYNEDYSFNSLTICKEHKTVERYLQLRSKLMKEATTLENYIASAE